MTNNPFDALFAEAEQSLEYRVEGAMIQFTEELSRVMADRDVTRSELARRIGASPAYVTRILRGNANLTLALMVKLARALGQELHVRFAPDGRP